MVKVFACGVNEYRGAINLDFCVNDSREFCSVFQENIIINQEDITIATDDGEISNTEYCKRLKEFCDASSEEDILVVCGTVKRGYDRYEKAAEVWRVTRNRIVGSYYCWRNKWKDA